MQARSRLHTRAHPLSHTHSLRENHPSLLRTRASRTKSRPHPCSLNYTHTLCISPVYANVYRSYVGITHVRVVVPPFFCPWNAGHDAVDDTASTSLFLSPTLYRSRSFRLALTFLPLLSPFSVSFRFPRSLYISLARAQRGRPPAYAVLWGFATANTTLHTSHVNYRQIAQTFQSQ